MLSGMVPGSCAVVVQPRSDACRSLQCDGGLGSAQQEGNVSCRGEQRHRCGLFEVSQLWLILIKSLQEARPLDLETVWLVRRFERTILTLVSSRTDTFLCR